MSYPWHLALGPQFADGCARRRLLPDGVPRHKTWCAQSDFSQQTTLYSCLRFVLPHSSPVPCNARMVSMCAPSILLYGEEEGVRSRLLSPVELRSPGAPQPTSTPRAGAAPQCWGQSEYTTTGERRGRGRKQYSGDCCTQGNSNLPFSQDDITSSS